MDSFHCTKCGVKYTHNNGVIYPFMDSFHCTKCVVKYTHNNGVIYPLMDSFHCTKCGVKYTHNNGVIYPLMNSLYCSKCAGNNTHTNGIRSVDGQVTLYQKCGVNTTHKTTVELCWTGLLEKKSKPTTQRKRQDKPSPKSKRTVCMKVIAMARRAGKHDGRDVMARDIKGYQIIINIVTSWNFRTLWIFGGSEHTPSYIYPLKWNW